MVSSKSLSTLCCRGVLLATLFLGTAHGVADSCEDTPKGEFCEEPAEASLIQARSQQRMRSVRAQETSDITCDMANVVMPAIEDLMNSQLQTRLKQEDPLELAFVSDDKIELPGCDVDLNITSRLSLSGLSKASIQSLDCSDTQCLKWVWFLCKEYGVTADTTVGIPDLVVSGSVDADWGICSPSLKLPSGSMSMGFDIVNPSIGASVIADAFLGIPLLVPAPKITGMKILKANPGTLANFKCDFPNWKNAKLDEWCTKILDWIVTAIRNVLQSLMEGVLQGLTEKQLAGKV